MGSFVATRSPPGFIVETWVLRTVEAQGLVDGIVGLEGEGAVVGVVGAGGREERAGKGGWRGYFASASFKLPVR